MHIGRSVSPSTQVDEPHTSVPSENQYSLGFLSHEGGLLVLVHALEAKHITMVSRRRPLPHTQTCRVCMSLAVAPRRK